jgi:hypothetical protein
MSKGKWLLSLVLFAVLGCTTPQNDSTSENNSNKGDFNYASLQLKDLDEMRAVVNKQIKKSEQFLKDDDEGQAVTALQSALQYILSRPNRDNMVSQLVPDLRSKLRELDALEPAIDRITDAAIYKIKDKKNTARNRATQYFVLENILSEFKPESQINEELKKIFVKIRDAQIELDSSITNDMKMRAMYKKPESPSDVAKRIIGPSPEK